MSIGELNAEDLEGLVGRELDGRYLLDKYIDRGGFGAVYRGIDKKLGNKPVAVKIGVGLSYREFMKEAKLATEVQHDHIVQISDYGNDKGLAYLVMEFLQGDDLEKLFKKQGCCLTPDQLRKFVSEIGDALAHAHADHLIHRDLKPRNIILKQAPSKTGGTASAGKFVLFDFGIAAKLDAEGTQRNRTQDGAGTVEYMAPELLRMKPMATPQSDIYAFGILLYQMMVGRVPYPQSDTSHIALSEIVHAIIHAPPPRFAEVAPDRSYPLEVEELVLQCLEKDPARRPQTMTEVRDRFRSAFPPATKRRADYSQTIRPDELADTADQLAHETVSPRPDQPPSRWSWLFVIFVLMVVLLLAIGPQFLRPTLHPLATLTEMRDNDDIPDGSTLKLTAGDSVTLTFTINDLALGTVPEFASPDIPASVHVEMNNGPVPRTTKSFTLSVPDLNTHTQPGSLPRITFRATIPGGSDSFEKSVSLEIHRPQPWLPDDIRSVGFGESTDSRLCRVGTDVFASILERRVAGQTVRFRLVPATEIGDRRIKTFYVMEQLVTNSLFNEFAKQEPGFELQARTQNERGWEVADEVPVTDIYVLESQRFAQWLAGRSGSLPTTTEWELSAGYYDFLRVLEARYRQPPLEIPPATLQGFSPVKDTIPSINVEVWMGLGPALSEIIEPLGSILKERSPYGCQYARLRSGARPTEMTATLEDFATRETDLRKLSLYGIPGKNAQSLTGKFYRARLRGLGEPIGSEEVRWLKSDGQGLKVRTVEDLNDTGTAYLLPNEGIALESYYGFRVVLLTEIERK